MKPGMLQSMGSQRVRYDLAADQQKHFRIHQNLVPPVTAYIPQYLFYPFGTPLTVAFYLFLLDILSFSPNYHVLNHLPPSDFILQVTISLENKIAKIGIYTGRFSQVDFTIWPLSVL